MGTNVCDTLINVLFITISFHICSKFCIYIYMRWDKCWCVYGEKMGHTRGNEEREKEQMSRANSIAPNWVFFLLVSHFHHDFYDHASGPRLYAIDPLLFPSFYVVLSIYESNVHTNFKIFYLAVLMECLIVV